MKLFHTIIADYVLSKINIYSILSKKKKMMLQHKKYLIYKTDFLSMFVRQIIVRILKQLHCAKIKKNFSFTAWQLFL